MQEYGLTRLSKTGRDVRVIADGDYSKAKSLGITLSPNVLTTNATGSALTLVDDTIVAVGIAYFRFGQILCRITSGGDSGLWGPYDFAASDGRQTLTRGACAILDRTWIDSPAGLGLTLGTTHPMVIQGGRVWRDRLLFTTGTHSLANGPTVTEFEAAFPEISYMGL